MAWTGRNVYILEHAPLLPMLYGWRQSISNNTKRHLAITIIFKVYIWSPIQRLSRKRPPNSWPAFGIILWQNYYLQWAAPIYMCWYSHIDSALVVFANALWVRCIDKKFNRIVEKHNIIRLNLFSTMGVNKLSSYFSI